MRSVVVVLTLDDCELRGLCPPLAYGHCGNLTHGHAMNDGYGEPTHARFVLHVEDGAVDIVAIGVWPVEYHYLASEVGAGIHHAEHRYIIGIEPQSHILHIYDQHIERAHDIIRGALRVAVI